MLLAFLLAQHIHPVVLLGSVDQVEVQAEGGGDDARRFGIQGGDLICQRRPGLFVSGAALFGIAADALFQFQRAGRLLLRNHLSQHIADQVDGGG